MAAKAGARPSPAGGEEQNWPAGFWNSQEEPKEACGVFGILAPGEEVARLAYFGLFALQHRGQESAGIATFEGAFCRVHKAMGLVFPSFRRGKPGPAQRRLGSGPHPLLHHWL
jgi:amidophosphoribosyltransferase